MVCLFVCLVVSFGLVRVVCLRVCLYVWFRVVLLCGVCSFLVFAFVFAVCYFCSVPWFGRCLLCFVRLICFCVVVSIGFFVFVCAFATVCSFGLFICLLCVVWSVFLVRFVLIV